MKGFKVWDNVYDQEVNPTKYPKGKEMPSNWADGKDWPKGSGKLVYRPAVIGVNPPFDSAIQTRTINYVIDDSQVTINYSVSNKSLNEYKKFRGRQFKQAGWNLLLAKYPDEFDRDGAAYAADKSTLKTYVNILMGELTLAKTVQEVKNITPDWPNI
mgnify:CR=1 FL=1|tara:strand:+ start:5273 stop:5743 length:471 start_codon:yes stop_codon:yes gene_type:complete